MKNRFLSCIVVIVLLINNIIQAQEKINTDRLSWFQKAKFGMFIHWGIYSVPAQGEWYQYSANIPSAEYEKYAGQFNPFKYNAKEWVALAKSAGMKYIVITAKHHDGFCMFKTQLTEYNIVDATPYKHDPMKDLAEACHEAGIILCFYYSVKDWHHPEYPISYTFRSKSRPEGFIGNPKLNSDPDFLKYLDYMKGQLQELLTNYGPVGIIWFDYGNWFKTSEEKEKAREIVKTIHELQPNCLINNRLSGFGADYGTPEQVIPGKSQKEGFEVCMTLNNNWGYAKDDHDWKDPKTIIRNLVDIVSKGGNYLLNVGPTEEGVIPAEAANILKRVGQWLQTNGEAVYDAKPGIGMNPWWNELDILTTTNHSKWYLHLFSWPKDQKIFLDIVPKGFKKAYFLSDKNKTPLNITFYNKNTSMMIFLPPKATDELDSVITIEYND